MKTQAQSFSKKAVKLVASPLHFGVVATGTTIVEVTAFAFGQTANAIATGEAGLIKLIDGTPMENTKTIRCMNTINKMDAIKQKLSHTKEYVEQKVDEANDFMDHKIEAATKKLRDYKQPKEDTISDALAFEKSRIEAKIKEIESDTALDTKERNTILRTLNSKLNAIIKLVPMPCVTPEEAFAPAVQ